MNKHKNYYGILGINRASNAKEIKLAYYAMSKENHPDKGGDEDKFKEITEAYKILSNNSSKDEYDKKSKYGANYDELLEIYDYEFNNDAKNYDKDKYEEWKTAEQLNIIVYIDDTFNGSVEYERWVVCKSCNGSGKDLDSKIAIRDEKGNIVRYFDASDGCDFCFEEKNYVITNNGPVKINDIKIDDMVLSKNNTYEKVIKLMQRQYTGEIFDINISGLEINGVTPNHKFNIVRFKRNNSGRVNINDYELLEIAAEDLSINDFVLYQEQKYYPKDRVFLEKTHTRKEISIEIDSNFIKFIACYIAEGNTRGDRVVCLTFHKEKDKELINFVNKYINSIGFEIKILKDRKEWGDKVCKIEIYNSQLSKFIKNFCGHLAENKFINPDILGKHNQILIDTLMLCDGSKKENCRTYSTISKKLAYQIFHLSQNLGYNTSISSSEKFIDKTGVTHQKSYKIYVNKSSKMGLYTKIIKDGKCLKIKNINKRNVILTDVYNITVENTHKYTIDGLLVNNCDGTGKWGELDCLYCRGNGKVNAATCKTCNGDKRILGKQKLSKIKIDKDAKDHKVEYMGNSSKEIPGKVGHLWLVRKKAAE